MSKKSSSIETKKTILIVLISLCIVGLVVVGLLFLLQGNTTTSGTKTSNEKAETLVCSGTNIEYPKLSDTNAQKEELKTTLIFSNKKLDTIGLIYTIYYTDEDEAMSGKNILGVKFGTALGNSGLDSTALGNKFNTYENRLTLNLFAENSEINSETASYFLINASEGQLTNWTIEDYTNNYTGQGFNCEQS